jgi:SET domain-containing protein
MKEKFFLSEKIKIQESPQGRLGVFAVEAIKEGEVIEKSPLILLENNRWEECDPELMKYAYPWAELRSDWKEFCDKHGGILPIHATRPVMVCGYGSFYRRAVNYNVEFSIEKKLFACHFKVKRAILANEELLIYRNEEATTDERQSPKV